ncbi:hypothetical protein L1049_008834 [Liquidambar formosana]|uniref:Peptidase A1 domain-containing protein n=1 Tax=Liquidambar formosana TaxID=63359 RepID=A0AAP0S3L8_LIQFO
MAVALHALFIFITFISLACGRHTIAATNPRRFAAKLIHRNSPLSPFYKPNASSYYNDDNGDVVLKNSLSRYAYLSAKQRNPYNSNIIRTTQFPDGTEFLAKLSIGTPPFDFYAVMDTGSDVFWIQCKPCEDCYSQIDPIYDRTKSSTYVPFSCNSSACSFLPQARRDCDRDNKCLYHLQYNDGSISSGYLASEVLTFNSSGSISRIPEVIFGCGVRNTHIIHDHEAGILSLGDGYLSLVNQLARPHERKFSYCFGNLTDPTTEGNLIIGEGSYIAGDETPLESDYFYYLTLIDISVGNKRLQIPPIYFARKPSKDGGVIIDSGTTLTFLSSGAYLPLEAGLKEQLEIFQRKLVQDPTFDKRTCFEGRIGRDLAGFPLVTFHFQGDADLVLEKWSQFQQVREEVFCLAFSMSPDEFNVIGNMAQQSYNFGFDLVNDVLTFENIDCSII